MNFWQKLAKKKKPFLALAPMEEVTDTVFRQMVACLPTGKPDVMFTEFVNVEGIVSQATQAKQAQQALQANPVMQRLVFSETERPIVAQIWGKEPKNFYEAARLISDGACLPAGRFDGVDINMGCPEKDVVKNGCCIALINDRNLAAEIIAATREGAGGLPVSVKTRIGLDKIATEDWCGFLLEQKIDALTVHGRTAKEKSDVPAHWDEIAKVVKMKGKTTIIGNGDIKNALDARRYALDAGVDGVMIGRGVLENIYCFREYPISNVQYPMEDGIRLLREHLELWEKIWGKTKNFAIMKKFVKAYVKGWEGAGGVRAKLFKTNSLEEMAEVLGSV